MRHHDQGPLDGRPLHGQAYGQGEAGRGQRIGRLLALQQAARPSSAHERA